MSMLNSYKFNQVKVNGVMETIVNIWMGGTVSDNEPFASTLSDDAPFVSNVLDR